MAHKVLPGTQIDGYRIESFLGQGGMGAVYEAVQVDSGERVALKLLNRELADSGESLREEARLNALVASPFVVKVLGDGSFDGLPYVVQEFIDGPELREGVADLTLDQKLDLSFQIGQGLSAAHRCGLIHRDLKPENIKIAADGTPRILDFGLARTFDPDELDESSFDEDGNIEGTLYYLSPEQLTGEKLTPGTDIFSFGVLFYELMTGQRPFEGEYTASIVYSILHEEIIPPTDIDPELPHWLNNITSKLLAKKRADRFETIDAAVAFIEEHRRDDLVPAGEWKRPTRKVTVIDLRNRSGDADWDYFCEGFTEDVVRELTRRTNLIVSAEPSTSYSRDISQTFEKCRTDFIVSGSLLRWKENIKLNLSIHGREAETVLWSETFSDDSDNLFDLLDRAAREASGKLAEVTDSATVQIGEEFQPDVTAYDYYLKGRSYYQTNRPEDLSFAEEMFNKALEIEPQFALAHAGLADVLVFRYMAFYDRSKENIQRAYDEATRAIGLDPALPDGHRSIARYYMFTGSLGHAEQSLLTAVEINPKYAIGYRTLGWLKRAEGNLEAAMQYTGKALELAPTDLETLLLLGLLNMDGGKLTAAMATLNRATELGPDYGRAYYYLGLVYMKLGALDAALKNLVLAEKYKGDPNCLIDAGMVYLMKGESGKARAEFEASIEAGYFPFVAVYYLGLTARLESDTDEAIKQFERAVEMLQKFDLEGEENLHLKLYMAMALAGAGRQPDTRRIIAEIENETSLSDEQRRDLARCYALLGDVETTVRLLEETMESAVGLTDKEIGMDPHFRDIPYLRKGRE